MIRGIILVLGLIVASDAYSDLAKTRGDKETETVEAIGWGSTPELAEKDGCKNANEQVSGVVVIRDLESSNGNLVKDFTGTYSASYPVSCQRLEVSQDSNDLYSVKVKATVASSKIAHRKLSQGNQSEVINGHVEQFRLSSEIEQRDRGDRLLAHVLMDSYPYNAYVPSFTWRTEVDRQLRVPVVIIKASITTSEHWIKALNEAVDLVAVDSAGCNGFTRLFTSGRYLGNGVKKIAADVCGTDADIFIDNKSYYFADDITLSMINSQLQQPIEVFVEFLDASGTLLDSRCVSVKSENFINYKKPSSIVNLNEISMKKHPQISHKRFSQEWVYLDDKNIIKDLAKIKLKIQQTCT